MKKMGKSKTTTITTTKKKKSTKKRTKRTKKKLNNNIFGLSELEYIKRMRRNFDENFKLKKIQCFIKV